MAGVKNVIGGTFEDIGEAVVKPVVDEVGRAIETGTRAVAYGANPPGQDPKQSSQKETDRQKKISDWRWVLQKQQEQANAQTKVRQEYKQKHFQETQVVEQERKAKNLQVTKKKENIALWQAKTKTEVKDGVIG